MSVGVKPCGRSYDGMSGISLRLVAALAAALVSAAAGAMTSQAPQGHCTVIDASKLPLEAGGSEGLCRAIELAVAKRSPGLRYTAEVRVISKASLSAALRVEGRALPEQKFAVSDRDLNAALIERFARSIAEKLAEASSR